MPAEPTTDFTQKCILGLETLVPIIRSLGRLPQERLRSLYLEKLAGRVGHRTMPDHAVVAGNPPLDRVSLHAIDPGVSHQVPLIATCSGFPESEFAGFIRVEPDGADVREPGPPGRPAERPAAGEQIDADPYGTEAVEIKRIARAEVRGHRPALHGRALQIPAGLVHALGIGQYRAVSGTEILADALEHGRVAGRPADFVERVGDRLADPGLAESQNFANMLHPVAIPVV